MTNTLKVLSCVPKQQYHFADKLKWAEQQLKKHKPDLIVLPQEYHGGVQTRFFIEQGTTEKLAYDPDEITGPYSKLSKKYGAGIAVGAVVDDPDLKVRRERIFIIDPDKGVMGWADKMMLPAYDHIDAVDSLPRENQIGIQPESDYSARAQAFTVCGANVSILFCWEVFSSFLWNAIARAQPDFVVSMIKFGVRGWPSKKKRDKVEGFGFGGDGGWVERLRMAAKWDLACPIVCSTNSWNLPKKAGALAGVILPWDEKANKERGARSSTLWESSGPGLLDSDHVQVDEIDYMYWRHIRRHRSVLRAEAEQWSSTEARELTMSWKVRRMEREFAGLKDTVVAHPPMQTKRKGDGLLTQLD